MAIKTLFFDLGNVLIFFSHTKMVEQMGLCTGLSSDEVRKILLENGVQTDYESGKISSEDVFEIFQKKAKRPFTPLELFEAASDIFTPNYEAWKIVEELKKRGYQLILLSNTSECHYSRIASAYPILRCFDKKILSFEVKALKPDLAIFEKAVAIAACSPKECFFTDDIEENVASARKMGIEGVVFTDAAALRKDLSARKLFA